jgi:peptidylprolyl isomerase
LGLCDSQQANKQQDLKKEQYSDPMPKTSKRAATRRAEKIARAHATRLPEAPAPKKKEKRGPGYTPPKRGLARYPWAITLTILIIAAAIGAMYYYKIGPFAPPKPQPKTAAVSPCLKVVKQLTDSSPAPTGAAFNKIQHTYKAPPAMSINTNKIYCAGINTNRGLIVVELDPKLAPETVNNFVFLAQHHFYDGLKFHRVVPNYIIQTGDPKGDGSGGPGYTLPAEPVKGNYTAGAVAMAKPASGTTNNGSQFFICVSDQPAKELTKSYNLFGHVVQGMDVVKKIQGPGDQPSQKNITPDVITHLIVVTAP